MDAVSSSGPPWSIGVGSQTLGVDWASIPFPLPWEGWTSVSLPLLWCPIFNCFVRGAFSLSLEGWDLPPSTVSLPLGLLFLFESMLSNRGGRAGGGEAGSLGRRDYGCDFEEDDLVWIARGGGGGERALGCGVPYAPFPG